jgi:hypothetical protein
MPDIPAEVCKHGYASHPIMRKERETGCKAGEADEDQHHAD